MCFLQKRIYETITTYLQAKIFKIVNIKENNNNETYFKLPFVGKYSAYVSKIVKIICKQFCKKKAICKIKSFNGQHR